jgi:hypothetical protein
MLALLPALARAEEQAALLKQAPGVEVWKRNVAPAIASVMS